MMVPNRFATRLLNREDMKPYQLFSWVLHWNTSTKS